MKERCAGKKQSGKPLKPAKLTVTDEADFEASMKGKQRDYGIGLFFFDEMDYHSAPAGSIQMEQLEKQLLGGTARTLEQGNRW